MKSEDLLGNTCVWSRSYGKIEYSLELLSYLASVYGLTNQIRDINDE